MSTTVYAQASSLIRTRAADYLELTKPRITFMVLLTVAAGAALASTGPLDWIRLCQTLLGTTLVASGASALNQLFERDSDARMRRTENRPLPAGRLQPLEVLFFGLTVGIIGSLYLAICGQGLAALVAAFTFLSYVFLYTPLKRITTLNTLVGAVPGALPPVIGWASVRESFGSEIGVLFLILFLWQVPHFLAIAWMYRQDYDRAGLRMLPVIDASGAMTGRQMIAYCLALVAVSLMPLVIGRAGGIYLAGAVVLGAGFLASASAFALQPGLQRARGVLRVSLVYLPCLLALLLLDATPR
jgi:protoheme IX farnesyltransferase